MLEQVGRLELTGIRLPRQHVSRGRLVGELIGSPVGVIEAAAGYGKSVLAGEYQAALGVACAWVSLGPPDDDPSVLVSSLRRAFRAAKLSDLYPALDGGDPERWPDRFLDALAGLADPLLVVLDDAHHLSGHPSAALVMRIAKGITLPHRLLVTGRWIPDQLDLPGGVVGAAGLWPGADIDHGRNRLKNLLSRLRAAVGDVLVREADSVVLAAGAESDIAAFEDEARRALATLASGEGLHAAMLARTAVDRYRGDLLPDDRYQPWAAEPRERLRLRYLELLDLLAAQAEASGEADEAARLIQRAIGSEPYDEERYLRLAALFAEQGRSGSSRAVLRRARAVLGETRLATPH
jgi:Bacterial transcriptional activator domain